MKKLMTILMTLTVGLLMWSPSAMAQSVEGTWKTIDDETGKAKSHVKIWKDSSGKLRGKIIKLLNPSRPNPTCDKCKGKLKGKPIEGMTIMWGLSKDDDEWEDGTILDPKKGKTYDCKIWLEGKDKLKVRGYVAMFYRTQTWYRIK